MNLEFFEDALVEVERIVRGISNAVNQPKQAFCVNLTTPFSK